MAIVLLGLLVAISLLQLSSWRIQAMQDGQARQAAADVARQFAVALITYDYAHPGVQYARIDAVSSTAVDSRIRAAFADLATAKAASIGEAIETVVVAFASSEARVLVRTTQLVSAQFVAPATKLSGLLDVEVSRTARGWVVWDFSWLLAPSGTP